MASLPKADLRTVQGRVLSWFDEHGRAFPWRQDREPYRIFVSEVMLQQTQAARVAPSYVRFVDHFPTVRRLAHSPAMEVIRAWRGLGYNRRAVDLQRAAQVVERDHAGSFPSDPRVLRALPGIGEYSANAIACFAFDVQVPAADVNVQRVLARVAHGREPEAVDRAALRQTVQRWLPPGEAYRWNQALMDVGAMVCRKQRPLCEQCPFTPSCRFFASGRHRSPRVAHAPTREPYEGSQRQRRGGVVDRLRAAALGGLTLSSLARSLHPQEEIRDLTWLVELLEGLERHGLVVMSPAARKGSPRGLVRLPL